MKPTPKNEIVRKNYLTRADALLKLVEDRLGDLATGSFKSTIHWHQGIPRKLEACFTFDLEVYRDLMNSDPIDR